MPWPPFIRRLGSVRLAGVGDALELDARAIE